MMYCVPLNSLTMADLPSVGGKNASLGGMMNALTSAGVRVPDGFAVTVQAYRDTLDAGRLPDHLGASLAMLDVSALSNLTQVSE